MFGRATIRLGIGPHSSYYYYQVAVIRSMAWVDVSDAWWMLARPLMWCLVHHEMSLSCDAVSAVRSLRMRPTESLSNDILPHKKCMNHPLKSSCTWKMANKLVCAEVCVCACVCICECVRVCVYQCVRRYRHALIVLHSLQQQTDDNADLLRLNQCE